MTDLTVLFEAEMEAFRGALSVMSARRDEGSARDRLDALEPTHGRGIRATMRMQRCARRRAAVRGAHGRRDAAVCIGRVARGANARRASRARRHAASSLQAAVRRWLAAVHRRQVRARHLRAQAAAHLIQSRARTTIARGLLLRRAAAALQAVSRRRHARRGYWRARRAAVLLQSHARRVIARRETTPSFDALGFRTAQSRKLPLWVVRSPEAVADLRLDRVKLEEYLDDATFRKVLGMPREEWAHLKAWKQTELKKRVL